MMWRSTMIVFYLFLPANLLFVIDAKKNKTFNERADLYATLKDCDFYESNVKNYTDFFQLDAFEDTQTPDTLVQFPVYVIGARDAHFCLSAIEWPDWKKDFAYEIMIGGWGNKRSAIRKKISAYVLNEVHFDGLLNIRKPTKFLIEITKAGYINVYNGSEPKPFVSAFDPKPIPVKYISFAGPDRELQVEFLYNCSSLSKVPTTVGPSPTIATGNSASSLADADISVLAAKCQVVESWENIYDNFIPLSSIQSETSAYNTYKIELFVVASRDANILLSSNDIVNVTTDDVYQIVVGGWKNTRHFIRRHVDGDALTELELHDILSPNKQVKVVIQRAKDGLIEVFFGDKYYKPALRTIDKNPLPVNFVSFASYESLRALFFYNCNTDEASGSADAESVTAHPLLATRPIDDANVLGEYCKVHEAFEDEYETSYEIAKFGNEPTNDNTGYYFRLPLWVQGERDASILISVDKSTNTHDVYEIIIGGWGNTRTVINKNGIRLAEVIEYNILNADKPVKLIIELSTADSNLKIFTDYNKYKPLLNVTDPDPIKQIRYISFAGYYRDLKFFFDCNE